MPAKNLSRVVKKGTLCHIYNKGVETRNIFNDEKDYEVFIGYLKNYLTAPSDRESAKKIFVVHGRKFKGTPHQPKNYFGKVELIAYSLMPSHFHLVLHQKTENSVQGLIRSLCTRYSMYFNKKYHRTGALFDGPYKSAYINNDDTLSALICYLNQNEENSSHKEYLEPESVSWIKHKKVADVYNKELLGEIIFDLNDDNNNLEGRHLLAKEVEIEQLDRKLPKEILASNHLKPLQRIPEITLTFTIFFLLLIFAIKNIQANTPIETSVLSASSETNVPTPSPSASPSPQKLTVRITDGAPSVNIRQKPTVSSEKIGDAFDGDVFEFVPVNSDWCEIKLQDGSIGFVTAKYIEVNTKDN